MKSSGLFRVGRDAELRYLPNGDAVSNVSLAFNYGKKGEDGSRPTQWIEGSIFGKRAETLAPMLLKGSQHCFFLSDCHLETYEGKNGAGTKMVGRIDDVQLTARQDAPPARQAPPQQAQSSRPAQGSQRPAQRAAPKPADDWDDGSDIPF